MYMPWSSGEREREGGGGGVADPEVFYPIFFFLGGEPISHTIKMTSK